MVIWFAKRVWKKISYNLYSADAVAKGYGLRPACFKNQRESKCDIGSDVFRCSSFDSLFEKSLTYNETKVAFDLEKSLERCLNSLPLTEVRTQDITEQIIPVLEVLQRYSEDLEKAAKSKEDRWMQQALKLRLHSMYRSFNEGIPQNYELFFLDHFSLNPKVLGKIVKLGFLSAVRCLREYDI